MRYSFLSTQQRKNTYASHLIITVIKSSIALSLGLVGALSIIRFRTPIKEPEELAYIFIAVAIGLGLGANQVMATLIGFVVVAIAMLPAMLKKSGRMENRHAYIDIVVPVVDGQLVILAVEALGFFSENSFGIGLGGKENMARL